MEINESLVLGKISNKTGIVYTIELDRNFFIVGEKYKLYKTKERKTIEVVLKEISKYKVVVYIIDENNTEQIVEIDIDMILSGEYRLTKLGEQEIQFSMAP